MRKYIVQQTYDNFVYPNNNVAIYDVNDVVQNINSNVVSGTVTNFVATLVGGELKIDFNYTWSKNNAEIFTNQSGSINTVSIHVMPYGVTYFKPWRCVDNITAVSGSTSASGVYSGTFSASTLGMSSLTAGVYYFEIRMIGALQNYIITQQYSVTGGTTPTPTPSVTATSGLSPTPTPSITSTPGLSATPTPTVTSSPGSPPSSPTPTASVTATPNATPTPTVTPTETPPGVYYSFNITNGYATSGDACLEGTSTAVIYGATAVYGDNAIFYSNPSLTTPFNGGGLYYKNTATNYYIQIDSSGNNTAEGSC